MARFGEISTTARGRMADYGHRIVKSRALAAAPGVVGVNQFEKDRARHSNLHQGELF